MSNASGRNMTRHITKSSSGILIVFLILAVVPFRTFSDDIFDDSIISYLKRKNVSSIDMQLASMPYEAWVRETLGPNAKISWEANDCGEGGDRPGPFPTCVTVLGRLNECGTVSISIAVGSSDKGLSGEPVVWNIYVDGIGPSRTLKSLHQLPDHLTEAKRYKYTAASYSSKPLDERTSVSFAKKIDIRTFVPSQEKLPFLSWFEAMAGPQSTVTWKLEGCDQVAASMELAGCHDYRACVYAVIDNSNESITVSIDIGTYRQGLTALPKVDYVSIYNKRHAHHGITDITIGELPAKVSDMRRADNVRN